MKGNPLRDSSEKPTDLVIEKQLGPSRFELYKVFKTELGRLGEPDLLWRGEENGWVLSLKGSEGYNGSIILTKEELIGQIVLSLDKVWAIRTDGSLPKSISSDVWFTLNGRNIAWGCDYFIEIPIESRERAIGFVALMELDIEYS